MIKTSTARIIAWSIFLFLLVACQAVATKVEPIFAPTNTITTSPLPTFTPTPAILNTAAASLPPSTSTHVSPSMSAPPDGLRMAYVFDGNIYFQDGSKASLMLTNSGEDRSPLLFSEDKDKIFFFRGRIPNSIYSIRTDGRNEQPLATADVLASISSEYDESTTFCDLIPVPHQNLLLFRTCSHPDETTTIHNSDLFIADANTNQVKRLFPKGQGGTFYVSPDGSKLAVDRSGQIDILGIDGKMIRQKLATYTKSEPIPLSSVIYWEADSKGLVLAVPVNIHYDTAPWPRYEIWRYSLDKADGEQIKLDPPLVGNDPADVSPDGNWIFYTNYDVGSFYLGDLREGYAQLYESNNMISHYGWSTDNIHFLFGVYQPGGQALYLGANNSPPALIGKGYFIGWLDASHYLYHTDTAIIMGEIGGANSSILTDIPMSLFYSDPSGVVFAFQPSIK